MSRIVTFYSYKGGVGRTMSLANIAVLLASSSKRVLVIDWDLEAPGLHRYFNEYLAPHNEKCLGLARLLHSSTGDIATDWRSFVERVQLPNGVELSLIRSGDHLSNYAELVRNFSWSEFFSNHSGGVVLDSWRHEWKTEYDYILIDSRTGVTDTGGVCTVFMPDIIAFVFNANEQSFDCGLEVMKGIQKARRELDVPRPPAAILPIVGRFDGRDEIDNAEIWKERFSAGLKPFYGDWLPRKFTARKMLERTIIPYVSKFSFGEPLPVISHGTTDPDYPGLYFDNIARLLLSDFRSAPEIISPVEIKNTEITKLKGLLSLINRISRHQAQGKYDEALSLYDELTSKYDAESEVDLRDQIAIALANKSGTLGLLGRAEEALEAADDFLVRFGDSENPELRGPVANVQLNRAFAFGELGRKHEEIAAYDEVVREHSSEADPDLLALVAKASVNKACVLGDLGDIDRATALYDEVVSRFEKFDLPDLQEQVAIALLNKAGEFSKIGKYDIAISTYDEIASRFGDSEEPKLRRQYLNALVSKAGVLGIGGEANATLELCNTILALLGERVDPRFRELFAKTLLNKAIALHTIGRTVDSVAVYDELIERFRDDKDEEVRERVAQALFNKGAMLGILGDVNAPIQASDELLIQYGNDLGVSIQVQVAKGLVNRGAAFVRLSNYSDALSAYEEVLQRFGETIAPDLKLEVARASLNKATVLGLQNRIDESLESLDLSIRKFGDTIEEEIARVVIDCFTYKSTLFVKKWQETGDLRFLVDASDAAKQSSTRGGSCYQFACVLALQGDSNGALDALESSLERGQVNWAHVDGLESEGVDPDPDWIALRDHPRYLSLKSKYGKA